MMKLMKMKWIMYFIFFSQNFYFFIAGNNDKNRKVQPKVYVMENNKDSKENKQNDKNKLNDQNVNQKNNINEKKILTKKENNLQKEEGNNKEKMTKEKNNNINTSVKNINNNTNTKNENMKNRYFGYKNQAINLILYKKDILGFSKNIIVICLTFSWTLRSITNKICQTQEKINKNKEKQIE